MPRIASKGRIWRRLKWALLALLLLPGLVLLAACVGYRGPAIAPTPLPTRKVLDMHCHVAGIGAGESGCYLSPDLQGSYKYSVYLRAFGVSTDKLREHGDQLLFARLSARLAESEHVAAAVVLALDGVVNNAGQLDLERAEFYVPNEFVAAETRKYPNLYYGASVNPYRHDALQRLEQAASDGAVLVKWLPAIMHIDPSDKKLEPFYLKLVELGLPLLTHAGFEHSFTRAAHELGDPELLRLPLGLGVTVIAAHAASTGKTAGQDNMERLLAMMPEYPRLYVDLSSLTQLNKLGFLSRLLRHSPAHPRLLYGTDMPLIETPLVAPWYFAFNLTLREMWGLSRIDNAWDQDVRLKQALGVPTDAFTRSAELLEVELPQPH